MQERLVIGFNIVIGEGGKPANFKRRSDPGITGSFTGIGIHKYVYTKNKAQCFND